MNVAQLRAVLATIPDDTEVWVFDYNMEEFYSAEVVYNPTLKRVEVLCEEE